MRLVLFLSLLALALSVTYSPVHAAIGVLIGLGIVVCIAAGVGIAEALWRNRR